MVMKRLMSLLSMLLFLNSAQASHCCYQPEFGCSGGTYTCPTPCCVTPEFCDWIGMNGFFAEFLYWNTYGDGLRWAQRTTTILQPAASVETVYTHKFDFKPGFRIGFNHICPCNDNDVSLVWTYYWNDTSSSAEALLVAADVPPVLTSAYLNLAPTVDDPTDEFLDSSINFRLNRIDLTYGHNTEFWNGLVFNCYGGAVFWSTNQNLAVHGLYSTPDTVVLDQVFSCSTLYRGAGAQIGMRLNWDLWCGFVLSANGGIAGTVGSYDLNERVIGAPGSLTFLYRSNDSYWTGRYATSLGLSLRYAYCECNQFVVYSSLGWEFHQYFDQTSFQVLPSSTDYLNSFAQHSSNLIIHGLTFTVGTIF